MSDALRIDDVGIVADAPAMFPAAVRTPTAHVVAYSTVPDGWPGGEVHVTRSLDGGATWTRAVPVAVPRGDEEAVLGAIGMARLSDGTILLPVNTVRWTPGEGTAGRRIALRLVRSRDDGATWDAGDDVRIDFHWPAVYGEILEFDDGELLWPIWGRQRAEEKWRSAVLSSRDAGASWRIAGTIAFDPDASLTGAYVDTGNGDRADGDEDTSDPSFRPHDPTDGFSETSVCLLEDGRLLAVLRQQGVGRDETLRFHRAYSADRGATWTPYEQLAFSGMSPALARFGDGRLLLVSRRCAPEGSGIEPAVEARVGDPQGATWSEPVALRDPRDGRLTAEYQCGYPAVVREGSAFRVYFYSYDERSGRYVGWNTLARP
ncbi:sialidase family protein [Microbacterium sp. NPDC028030]|uniref:sialidase family protein n=1 Tax=Microbacterium sp. NPDC028030 TaxID=3155124 RepID=UPI003408E1E1